MAYENAIKEYWKQSYENDFLRISQEIEKIEEEKAAKDLEKVGKEFVYVKENQTEKTKTNLSSSSSSSLSSSEEEEEKKQPQKKGQTAKKGN